MLKVAAGAAIPAAKAKAKTIGDDIGGVVRRWPDFADAGSLARVRTAAIGNRLAGLGRPG